MSLPKRVSLPPQPPPQQQDLKNRVITCLNKLSDRDTLSVATAELESIARTLTDETFAPFLSYISSTSSSDKPSVRRQCIKILSTLSVSHGDDLLSSPHHVSKMLAAVVKRLRDHDTSVRTACVHAVTSMSSQMKSHHSFGLLSKPLLEAVMTEQEHNAQMGSALCLSAAIDSSCDPECCVELRKILPKVLKLVKSDGFKAKSGLLKVVGSIVGSGSGSGSGLNKNSLNMVVICLVEFFSSEDWGVRKAAVEALGRMAESEKGSSLIDFKASCVTLLENKRFDKVKVVRESMNHTLQLWKEIPEHEDEVQISGISSSTVRTTVLETPSKETYPSSKQSPTATPSRSPPNSNYRKRNGLISRKTDFEKETDSKVKVSEPKPGSAEKDCKEKIMLEKTVVPDTVDTVKSIILETEKRVVSNRARFGSRVVPLIDDCEMDIDIKRHEVSYSYGDQKEVDDMSRIQKQLVQIENQQSNLLNLLQKFIGSSRSGMNSLETRVNGLEKVLDEISYDLAISNGRVSSADSCCMSTEFLSPKYWRKAEGSTYHSPRSPFRGSHQSPSDRYLSNKDFNPDVNTPECGFGSPGRSLESLLNVRKKKVVQGHNRHFDRFDGGS